MPGRHGRRPGRPHAVIQGRAATATLLALGLAAGAAGCGAAGPEARLGSTDIALSRSAPPSAGTCGFGDAAALREAAATATVRPSAAPLPGAYLYATRGSTSDPEVATGTRPLPSRSTAVVTPARTAAGLRCFGRRLSFERHTDTSNVYVVRGDDLYVVGVGVGTPHLVQRVLPRPAILGLSGHETRWAGAFRGRTSGTYDVEVLGRRSFRVGDRTVTAVGVASRATYRGEVEGEQTSRAWMTTGRSLVVAESGRSVLRIGGAEERLEYRNRLLSLQPTTANEG